MSKPVANQHKIAIAIIHGTGPHQPDYADVFTDRLFSTFEKILNLPAGSAGDCLVTENIYWIPIVSGRSEQLWHGLSKCNSLRLNSLRKKSIDLVSAAMAYESTQDKGATYTAIHDTVSQSLTNLSSLAGDNAPLCVIAHSFGSVIISDYFYDLNHRIDIQRSSSDIEEDKYLTALENGDTFLWYFTLGSPLALWRLACDEFDQPISVPSSRLIGDLKGLDGGWINLYDPDDIIGYPLKQTSAQYQTAIKDDIMVEVGGFIKGHTPLSHYDYWLDDDVLDVIAGSLAKTWEQLNAANYPE